MLKEVCEALLGVCLHQRTGVEAKAHRRLPWGRLLLADRIAHAVGQGAEADIWIGGDIGTCLGPLAGLQLNRGGGGRFFRRSELREWEARRTDGEGQGDDERGGRAEQTYH